MRERRVCVARRYECKVGSVVDGWSLHTNNKFEQWKKSVDDTRDCAPLLVVPHDVEEHIFDVFYESTLPSGKSRTAYDDLQPI